MFKLFQLFNILSLIQQPKHVFAETNKNIVYRRYRSFNIENQLILVGLRSQLILVGLHAQDCSLEKNL